MAYVGASNRRRDDPLASRAPLARQSLLSLPDPARPQHAHLLHHLCRDGRALLRGPDLAELSLAGAAAGLARLRADAAGHAGRQCAGPSGPGRRALHVLPAAPGASALLPWHLPLRRRRADRDGALFRRARGGAPRGDLRRLHPSRQLRRTDRGHHCGHHAVARRRHLHSDLAVVARLHASDPQIYRMVWWGLGRSSQQINVTRSRSRSRPRS